MAKQQVSQHYIFKIHSSRLRRAKWDLTLPLHEARRNDEVIAMSDGQVMRWIDQINHVENGDEQAQQVKKQIRHVKQQPSTIQNRREIRRLYNELDRIQFKPDYLHLVIDRDKDMYRACKGFKVNGMRFTRLLGTNGGVKNSTIVFVNEAIAEELRRRIDNGRNPDVEHIPAKLEAYRALCCSGSTPVSMPRGILVVSDCKTIFREDVIMLNDEGVSEPEMSLEHDFEVTLKESDGYGLMLPTLARRWSEELGLDYVASGMNTRFSWEKGMVFTFDFLEFADTVAGTHMVKDAWGHEMDITEVELILTTSMLKLWNCYDSMKQYLECCRANGYTFGITKTCPRELEQQRRLNYQFIQSYDLTDEQIYELVSPTIQEIRDVISGDYRKTLIFLAGEHTTEDTVDITGDPVVAALMADKRMFNDPYIKRRIFHQIENRIKRAKIGVVAVHGNYSILCGDPYALCQHIWGLPVTGLLRAGQLYNRYWADKGVEYVACFRAPMTCHNNIRKMAVANSEGVNHWYRYMTTCTLFNAWDTTSQALNGADKDGDLVMLTDNKVLVENIRPVPTIFCAQRNAETRLVSEDDLVRANIASFGDDIGKTTNWITSMFEVQAGVDPNSREYKVLDYRIKCGQLLQQNCIDKAKGIISKPMPRHWYDRHACRSLDGEEAIDFNLRIVADRKPYFMRYIYPSLMQQYNTYINNTRIKCAMELTMDIDELLATPQEEMTEEQRNFVTYYYRRMPVGTNPCVMNRICELFEKEFDGYLKLNYSGESFDTNLMKSGQSYTNRQYLAVLKLYNKYNEQLREYKQTARKTRGCSTDETVVGIQRMYRLFVEECLAACSNAAQLCDLMIDICYKRIGTQDFAWTVCGDAIVQNLLNKNGGIISFPVRADDGDIHYAGQRFKMIEKRWGYEGSNYEREAVG